MCEGIVDYLEIMHLAGVLELGKSQYSERNISEPVFQSATLLSEPLTSSVQSETAAKPPVKEIGVKEIDKDKITIEKKAVKISIPENASKEEQLRFLADDVAQCTRCKDLASLRTQTVFGTGNPDSSLVFLGEAPGADEDKQGEPFVGRAGQLLTNIITKGMKLRREDVYICNILRCRPPGNRNPMPDEAALCRPFLNQTLNIIKPKLICCLGAVAAKNLLSTEATIGSLRGKVWEYNGIKVLCTYHPAYLLRNPAAKKDTWEDIQILMREMEKEE